MTNDTPSYVIPTPIVEESVALSRSQTEAALHRQMLWEPNYVFVEGAGRDCSTLIVDGRHKYNYRRTSTLTEEETWRCGRRGPLCNCKAILLVSLFCFVPCFLDSKTYFMYWRSSVSIPVPLACYASALPLEPID